MLERPGDPRLQEPTQLRWVFGSGDESSVSIAIFHQSLRPKGFSGNSGASPPKHLRTAAPPKKSQNLWCCLGSVQGTPFAHRMPRRNGAPTLRLCHGKAGPSTVTRIRIRDTGEYLIFNLTFLSRKGVAQLSSEEEEEVENQVAAPAETRTPNWHRANARKLVAYLLAVDKSGQPFQVRAPLEVPTQKAA